MRSLCLPLATILLASASVHAQSPVDPPAGQKVILTVSGKGVQIYACQKTGTAAPQWVFQAPDASLYDASGSKVGVHGAGPTWRYYDGSTVRGAVTAQRPSPEATAIPWLLLKAVDSDSGLLSRVQFIRRSDTHGGNAPATGCDAQHTGAEIRVPYTATYTFYSSLPAMPQDSEAHQH
jgi:Protein of unknown function (DUF3455)